MFNCRKCNRNIEGAIYFCLDNIFCSNLCRKIHFQEKCLKKNFNTDIKDNNYEKTQKPINISRKKTILDKIDSIQEQCKINILEEQLNIKEQIYDFDYEYDYDNTINIINISQILSLFDKSYKFIIYVIKNLLH
tara:strand:- start:2656 stop:3057 length:402 start_codon:yes stop_codon:yes gene_type:complete